MIDKLKGYFYLAIQKPVYLCSMLLDPHIKTNLLTPEVLALLKLSQEEILLIFKGKAKRFLKNQYNDQENSQDNNDGNSKNTMKSSLFKKKKKKITSLDGKIEFYLGSDCEDESYEPLVYWKANSNHLPTLASMAQTYLSIPASSAPTKRTFSAGRYIQDYTRNQLNVDTLQALLCLKNWLTEKFIDVDNISIPSSS